MKIKKQKRIEPNKYIHICKKNGVVYSSGDRDKTFNDRFLHKPCDEFKGDKWKLGWKLKKYLLNNKNAVGIASNQLGINAYAFAIRLQSGGIQAIINPYLIQHGGNKIIKEESCLSVKDQYQIERFDYIELTIWDYRNKRDLKLKFEGQDARVVQHELDHINGTLISDSVHNTY